VDEMSRVVGVALPIELTAIPGIDEELDSAAQRLEATGETARPTRQAGQIMTKFGIVALHTVSLALVAHRDMDAWRVEQGRIGGEIVAKVNSTIDILIYELLLF